MEEGRACFWNWIRADLLSPFHRNGLRGKYPEEAEEHCNPLHQLAGGKVESIKQNRLLRFGMPLQRHQEYGKVSLHDIESLAEMGKHTGLCGG